MELQVGKMSSQDIAKWMGISYGTFKNARPKKLEEMKNFCDFEIIHGGIIISKVHISTYVKNLAKNEDRIYTTMVLEAKDHLTSLAGITRKLIATYPEYSDVSYDTLYKRLRKAGIRGYGATLDDEAIGAYGKRRPVWAIKVSDLNEYRFMTEEEKDIYYNIISQVSNVIKNFEKIAWAGSAYESGEIIAEEAAIEAIKVSNNFFYNVILPFKNKTGLQLVRATEHEVFQSQIDHLFKD